MAERGHNGHGWRTLRRAVLSAEFLVCGICHAPIDKSIPWPDPWSPSVDLIRSWKRGGIPEPGNVRPAHLGCNSRRGAGATPTRRWTTTDQP